MGNNDDELHDPNQEGYNIVRKAWLTYWNKDQKTFIDPVYEKSQSQGRHFVWPVSIMVQSVIDAARIYPKDIGPLIEPAVSTFDAYYSPVYHAYCASFNFNGNKDIYYDDNAQVAACFLTAYEVTRNKAYLDKGVENVDFLMTGTDHGVFGGVRWHMQKQGCNTCTTAECGIAAAKLARFVDKNAKYLDFAKMCCDWVFEKLQDENNKLICDGLEPDGNGYKRNNNKWTYNQGTPLTLCSLLYSFTKDDIYRSRAEELAMAVTDHNSPIFDRDTRNMDARYYYDSTKFYQLLAAGFADFLLVFTDVSPPQVVSRVKGETLHMLKFVHGYIRDPDDGLYFETLRPYNISQEHYDKWKKLTGGENKKYEPSQGEREPGDGPIEERKLIKSLMGCGSAGRIFFQSARVYPRLD